MCWTINYLYYYSVFVDRTILKSSIVGLFEWLILFFMKDGASLTFLSSNPSAVLLNYRFGLKKLLIPFLIYGYFCFRIYLLSSWGFLLRAKGIGLKVVRRLWVERLCDSCRFVLGLWRKELLILFYTSILGTVRNCDNLFWCKTGSLSRSCGFSPLRNTILGPIMVLLFLVRVILLFFFVIWWGLVKFSYLLWNLRYW